MKNDYMSDWWSKPFPYKVKVLTTQVKPARLWLLEHGYAEWYSWNTLNTGLYTVFEFLNNDDSLFFRLRRADG